MLVAHKIQLRPNSQQTEYLLKACGSRRHCYNQMLAYFKKSCTKWSKTNAYQYYITTLRVLFPWYSEVSSRITRNAIDDLDNAFKHFFRRVRTGEKPGFPTFKKKGVADSFALREKAKFSVNGRRLKIEKLATPIKMRQKCRFDGELKQVTISLRAGKFYASILVDTVDYAKHSQSTLSVGVDIGINSMAVLSNGEVFPQNQKLRSNLKRLSRRQRNLSRKKRGSNRHAKAKQSVATLHKRISDQRQATLHELSHYLTAKFYIICIEDLNVKGMLRNRKLSRCIADAGFGGFRRQVEYKARFRNRHVSIIGRFEPTSKMCCQCGQPHSMTLSDRVMRCDCGNVMDRDHNAAVNIHRIGLDRLAPDLKRTQEASQTASAASLLTA